MNLLVERVYPAIGGIAAAAGVCAANRYGWTPPDSVAGLYQAGVELGAIAIGFVATAQTILISIDDRMIITRLKATRHYHTLVSYNFAALRWWALLTLVSVAAMLSPEPRAASRAATVVMALWVGSALTAVLSWWRVFAIYAVILTPGAHAERGTGVVSPRLSPKAPVKESPTAAESTPDDDRSAV